MSLSKGLNGSEIHRLKEFTHYDRERFERFYKLCKPLIRNLSRNVDTKRFNVSPDIIQSYFWDKFLHVYNKYQDMYEDERLKATLLSSLQIFKKKLLRNAYTKQAEFNQELTSFEVLYDNNKEALDNINIEEIEYRNEKSEKLHQFMKNHLTPDEYLLFRTELDPPPFLETRIRESRGKLSVFHIIEFFELPKNKKSYDIITEMRKHINGAIELAKEEFK